ncbi:hypothetical protein DSO57_1030849 [Entomophthora muscae]|uniref:Uncharacterized protein n=1 Tax=Entomophthora muscae TaxID=34485 RepID=A0ACC2RRU2_9FUNG|nr:hypothetical protein DSO57_1030849 [Entomophthora muscae]
MLLPVFKFLETDIFSTHLVRDNPIQLLYLLEDISSRAQDLLVTGKNLLKSLTCNDLDLFLPNLDLKDPCGRDTLESIIPVEKTKPALQVAPVLQKYALKCTVTKVTISMPQAGIEPAPSRQVGLVGRGDLPAPGFFLFKANPGAETIPTLMVAVGPILGPKSYTQALVGLVGPGQAIFSYPVTQFKPILH